MAERGANDPQVLWEVSLGPSHSETGRTRHTREGLRVENASVLKIVRHPGVEGVYLIHYDSRGNELTDTFHDSLIEAMKQAEWEYRVRASEWIPVEQTP